MLPCHTSAFFAASIAWMTSVPSVKLRMLGLPDVDRAAHVAAPAADADSDAHRVVLDLVGLCCLVGDPEVRVVLRFRITLALHLGRDRSADVLVEELQRLIVAARRGGRRPAECSIRREVHGRVTHRLRFRRRGRATGNQDDGDQARDRGGAHLQPPGGAAYLAAATMKSTALITDWSDRSVRPPFGGHEARLALVTLDRVLVQRVGALRDARRPGGLVAELRCAGDPCAVAGHAGLVVDLFAAKVGRRRRSRAAAAARAPSCPAPRPPLSPRGSMRARSSR